MKRNEQCQYNDWKKMHFVLIGRIANTIFVPFISTSDFHSRTLTSVLKPPESNTADDDLMMTIKSSERKNRYTSYMRWRLIIIMHILNLTKIGTHQRISVRFFFCLGKNWNNIFRNFVCTQSLKMHICDNCLYRIREFLFRSK